jgi:TRAP-type C4-dicarboxylate transport system permease small subunit
MDRQTLKTYVDRILVFLCRVEDVILVILLSTMIGMAAFQILFRNLFEAGIVWGDILVRILVLWLGLVGAMVATRTDKHIRIDIINRYLPDGVKPFVETAVKLFSAAVCAIVSYYSLQFVLSELTHGGLAFWKVPVWVCEAIIPVSFAVIALRYFFMSLKNISTMVNLNR